MSRQLFRSFGLACNSLGNHANGTERVRPSLSSTVRVSSVMVRFSIFGKDNSTAEVGIPGLQEFNALVLDYSLNTPYFVSTKADTVLQSDRINPEFD
jgi:hypothetical protein